MKIENKSLANVLFESEEKDAAIKEYIIKTHRKTEKNEGVKISFYEFVEMIEKACNDLIS